MENRRQVGSVYERQAEEYLRSQGYRILCRNYRCRTGEIDLVARERGYLVFVEVKYRADAKKGMPQEAVDIHKQQRICRVSDHYRMIHRYGDDIPCRFDVVAILGDDVVLIRDAFPYQQGRAGRSHRRITWP